jgi:hypothetical protein
VTKLRRYTTALIAITSLASCSTIIRGSRDTIRLTAPDCSKAMCEVRHSEGKQTVSYLPGTAIFDRGWKQVSIECWERGDKANVVYADLEPSLDGWTYGNVLLGGVIGTAIDVSQGSTGKLPDSVMLPLRC